MAVECPHCNATALAVNAFCTACGKAMPDSIRTRPRVVDESNFASSGAGRVLQAESLDRQARSAVRIMGWLGGLHMALAAVLIVVSQSMTSGPQGARGAQSATLLLGMGVILAIIGFIFLGLSFWARVTPLPAAITGLVIYVTLTVLDIVLAADSANTETMGRGLFIRVVVIGCLAKAVSAGVKHRALLREAGAAA